MSSLAACLVIVSRAIPIGKGDSKKDRKSMTLPTAGQRKASADAKPLAKTAASLMKGAALSTSKALAGLALMVLLPAQVSSQITDTNIATALTDWMTNPATTTYGDIAEWDVSAVTSMADLFSSKTTFNADISKWNVAAVTTLYNTFNGATAFNGDIAKWNVASVANLYGSFMASSAFNQNIGNWNVASVTSMDTIFYSASKFNQDISSWDTARVGSMRQTLASASNFDRNVGRWNVLSVTSFDSMASGTSALTASTKKAMFTAWGTTFRTAWPSFELLCAVGSIVIAECITNANIATAATAWVESPTTAAATYGDIAEWNTAAVTLMNVQLYAEGTRFNADVSKWNLASATSMLEVFIKATAFDADIGKWNVARVSNMQSAFSGATAFNQNVASWNVLSVTDFGSMWTDATAVSACNQNAIYAAWGATFQAVYSAWSSSTCSPTPAPTSTPTPSPTDTPTPAPTSTYAHVVHAPYHARCGLTGTGMHDDACTCARTRTQPWAPAHNVTELFTSALGRRRYWCTSARGLRPICAVTSGMVGRT